MNRSYDFSVIGAGIIGICIARRLKQLFPSSKIVVVEKEEDCGLHASTRNSGVLHAGFYYTPNSLKAKFTKEGNQRLTEYCLEKKLSLNNCGKLVVAKNESELERLDILFDRGCRNAIDIKKVSAYEASQIEPAARTHQYALFSPTTSVVSPFEVLHSLKQDATTEGIDFLLGAAFIEKDTEGFLTTKGKIKSAYLINAGGLYADEIAKRYGFSKNYAILPFKGLYLYPREETKILRTHIYPVPDLKYPFLGVHFTVTVDGKTKIGPTAIPAFWREQYGIYKNFQLGEFSEILLRQSTLFFSSDFNFKQLAIQEIQKYSKTKLVNLAADLVHNIDLSSFKKWGNPGIRAQLINITTKKLEMDFVFEGDHKSFHILNAVSPGFTCCLPFSEYVCDKIIEKIK